MREAKAKKVLHLEKFEISGKITRKWFDSKRIFRKHAYATLEDETASMTLNLWRVHVEQINVGDTVHLNGVFVKTGKGIRQIHSWEEEIR